MATMPCWNVANCEGWPKCGRHHDDYSKNGPYSVNTKKDHNQKKMEQSERAVESSQDQHGNPTHANGKCFDVPRDAELNREQSRKQRISVTSRKIQDLNPIYGNRNEYVATGLRNPGNWCYMNSVVQCLVNSESIVKMVLKNQENITGCSKWTLLNELRFLITVLRSGEYKYVTPGDLKKQIELTQKTFEGNGQHDAHEVLTTILDGIRTEIGIEKPEGKIEFEGTHKSQIECKHCLKSHSLKDEPFDSLHIDIKKENPTVKEGINGLTDEERIRDYRCESCNVLGMATKYNSLILPNTLIIQIKRFKKDKYGINIKDHSQVNYSPKMTLNNTQYELYAIIDHMGQNNGGHYKAYCKESISNKWYKYNDSTVSYVELESISKKNAYILFYKCDSTQLAADEVVETEFAETQRRSQRATVRSEKGKDWDEKREKKPMEKKQEKKNAKEVDVPNMKMTQEEEINDCSQKESDEFCFCKKEKPGEMMIECKKCEDWYHPSCMNYNCAKCREEMNDEKTNEIEEKLMEIAILKSNMMAKEAQMKEAEGRISRLNKSNEKLNKEKVKLSEKDEKNTLEKKKREQMIEEKVSKMCKANNDKMKKTTRELEEALEREKENQVVIANLEEDLLLAKEANKMLENENEWLKTDVAEKSSELDEISTKENICKQMEEALKLMTSNITSMSDDQAEESPNGLVNKMMLEYSITIRDAIASFADKDLEEIKRNEEIKSLKKDLTKKNGEIKQSLTDKEKCNAEIVKLKADNLQLQTQCQQQAESWKFLNQIHKDLELQVVNMKEESSDGQRKTGKNHVEEKTPRKKEKDVTRRGRTENNGIEVEESDVTVKVLTKEGDEDWMVTDLSIGTVDDNHKCDIKYMMIIEEKDEARKKQDRDQNELSPKKSPKNGLNKVETTRAEELLKKRNGRSVKFQMEKKVKEESSLNRIHQKKDDWEKRQNGQRQNHNHNHNGHQRRYESSWHADEERNSEDTRNCRFYQMGRCRFGKRCWFRHEEGDGTQTEEKRNPSICKHHLNGNCHFGNDCWFVHSVNRKMDVTDKMSEKDYYCGSSNNKEDKNFLWERNWKRPKTKQRREGEEDLNQFRTN